MPPLLPPLPSPIYVRMYVHILLPPILFKVIAYILYLLMTFYVYSPETQMAPNLPVILSPD